LTDVRRTRRLAQAALTAFAEFPVQLVKEGKARCSVAARRTQTQAELSVELRHGACGERLEQFVEADPAMLCERARGALR